MAHKYNRITNARNFYDGLPDYAATREWAKVLKVSYETLRIAARKGKLAGRRANGCTFHTKREIVAWYAPGLLESMDKPANEPVNISVAA